MVTHHQRPEEPAAAGPERVSSEPTAPGAPADTLPEPARADIDQRTSAPQIQAPVDRVRLGQDEGRLALIVGGVVQSVAVGPAGVGGGYWSAMIPDARPATTLILGLGAGTVARLLTARFGNVRIVGVEHDPAVVALAREHFDIDSVSLPGLEIVEGDAYGYTASAGERFDLICVDLYDGLTLARGTLAKPFLRDVKRRLAPGGLVIVNLVLSRRLPRHLHRLGEVFRITGTAEIDFNVVIYCRSG